MQKPTTAVANSSLFAGLKTLVPAADNLPAPFETTETSSPVSYVNFFTTKATKAGEIMQAIPGIAPGTPYVYRPGKGYQRLSNFKFHLIRAAQFWVKRDSTNKVLKAATKDPGDKSLTENIEALILTYTDDGEVVPALCTFNTAKAPVGRLAQQTLDEAATAEWFKKSPDHGTTSQIPIPNFRFTINVNSWVQPSKSTGFPTVNARGTAKPATVAEVQSVMKAQGTEEFQQVYNATQEAFTSKVTEIAKVAGVSK